MVRLAMALALLWLACGEVPQGQDDDLRLEPRALQAAAAGPWRATGSMAHPRVEHTATLLPSGKVLVVGGGGDGTDGVWVHDSAEVYDPDTGEWTLTGSLTHARYAHTATLLPDGKVLVIGGAGPGHIRVTSAEVYDPVTGRWTDAGLLGTGRANHTATLLPRGQVLVVGGRDASNNPLSSTELYKLDPATGTWGFTPSADSLGGARSHHTATLLPNGKVLVVGGRGGDYNSHRKTEMYDPATDDWTDRAWLPEGEARYNHTATLLPSGKVLVAGGERADWYGVFGWDHYAIETVMVYTPGDPDVPNSGSWGSTGNPLRSRTRQHTATLLPSGKVLVTGGEYDGEDLDTNAYTHNKVEAYEEGNGWTSGGSLGRLIVGRLQHTATLLPNGQVLVVGGRNGDTRLASAEVYEPGAAQWSATQGALTEVRLQHTATLLPSGKVLVAGGQENGGAPLASAEVYTLNATTEQSTPTGSLVTARSQHTATLLVSGQVLVAGGLDASGAALASAEVYTPSTGQWAVTDIGSLAQARFHHTATLLPGGKVLVAGGHNSRGNTLASAEVYEPETGQWASTSPLPQARLHHTATLLPGGKVLVVGGQGPALARLSSAVLYDPRTEQWSATGWLTQARSRHTATLLPNGRVLVVGGQDEYGLPLSSAEVYNPDTGEWSAAGSLGQARFLHTATLLLRGQVLVAGGRAPGGAPLTSAEVYDPLTAMWTSTGALVASRSMHTATLLASGQVLVTGGGRLSVEVYQNQGTLSERRAVIDPLHEQGPGQLFTVTGHGFRGLSEASSGNTQSSATNFPLVSLRAVEGGAPIRVDLQGSHSDTELALRVPVVPDGYYILSVTTNAIPSGQLVRVDGRPPAAPEVSAPGAFVSTPAPTIGGTAEPGSEVVVWLDGEVSGRTYEGRTYVDAAGAWSLTPLSALADGAYVLTTTATDAAGNPSPSSEPRSFTVDTAAPRAPEVSAPGARVNTSMPAIGGTAEAESEVVVRLDGAVAGTTHADAAGAWSLTPSAALADREYQLTATTTDAAGNTSSSSEPRRFTVDTVAPGAPEIFAPGAYVKTQWPAISGAAEAGSEVVVWLDGSKAGSAVANEAGAWSVTPATRLVNRSYQLTATTTDAAGNSSPSSEPRRFTVDTVAPGAPEITAPWASANTQRPAIGGTAEAGSTVVVWLNGKVAATTVADVAGAWSFTPTEALAYGHHLVSATATDAAGNTSLSAEHRFAIQLSHYGWSCAAAPALPASWALLALALWTLASRASSRRSPR